MLSADELAYMETGTPMGNRIELKGVLAFSSHTSRRCHTRIHAYARCPNFGTLGIFASGLPPASASFPRIGASELLWAQMAPQAAQSVRSTAQPMARCFDGGSTDAGRIQIFHAGQWGTVCAASDGLRATARVACRQLGARQPTMVMPAAMGERPMYSAVAMLRQRNFTHRLLHSGWTDASGVDATSGEGCVDPLGVRCLACEGDGARHVQPAEAEWRARASPSRICFLLGEYPRPSPPNGLRTAARLACGSAPVNCHLNRIRASQAWHRGNQEVRRGQMTT